MLFGCKPGRFVWLLPWTAAAGLMVCAGCQFGESPDGKTIEEQVAQYGPAAEKRLLPAFAKQNIPYPPTSVALLGFKQERVLEVWATTDSNAYSFVKSYRILAASGKPGPKLRQGDRQVPEGVYRIESLNANSHYHLALRIGYPSDFDRLNAQRDGRTNLGGDIMIHGGNLSSGCLAMGDEAAEDLFVLAAKTGIDNIVVILSPVDFRRRELSKPVTQPAWVETLYTDIKKALMSFPRTSEVAS